MHIPTRSTTLLLLLFLTLLTITTNPYVRAGEFCSDGRKKKRQQLRPNDIQVFQFVIDSATCAPYTTTIETEISTSRSWILSAADYITAHLDADAPDKRRRLDEFLATPAVQKFVAESVRLGRPADLLDEGNGLSDILKVAEDFVAFGEDPNQKPVIRVMCVDGPMCREGNEAYSDQEGDYINLCPGKWTEKKVSEDVKCPTAVEGEGGNLDGVDCKARAFIHEILHSNCYEDRDDEPSIWAKNTPRGYFTECCTLLANAAGWKGGIYRTMAARNADNGAWLITGLHFDHQCKGEYPAGIPAASSGCPQFRAGPSETYKKPAVAKETGFLTGAGGNGGRLLKQDD